MRMLELEIFILGFSHNWVVMSQSWVCHNQGWLCHNLVLISSIKKVESTFKLVGILITNIFVGNMPVDDSALE